MRMCAASRPTFWRCGNKKKKQKNSDFEIHLSPELKTKILSAYKDNNRRLAADIGIDLARYGYF